MLSTQVLLITISEIVYLNNYLYFSQHYNLPLFVYCLIIDINIACEIKRLKYIISSLIIIADIKQYHGRINSQSIAFAKELVQIVIVITIGQQFSNAIINKRYAI